MPATNASAIRFESDPYASHSRYMSPRNRNSRAARSCVDVRAAQDLRQFSEAAAAPGIDLPEPIARRVESLNEKRVVVRLRVDVWNAPFVDEDFRGLLEPVNAIRVGGPVRSRVPSVPKPMSRTASVSRATFTGGLPC